MGRGTREPDRDRTNLPEARAPMTDVTDDGLKAGCCWQARRVVAGGRWQMYGTCSRMSGCAGNAQ